MTAQQKDAFLTRFARTYDLPGAAAAAGITRGAAYELLGRTDVRERLDRLIAQRQAGVLLSRIRGEYEAIAFDESGDAKAADRMRAMEQLRLIAAAEGAEGGTGAAIVRVEYV